MFQTGLSGYHGQTKKVSSMFKRVSEGLQGSFSGVLTRFQWALAGFRFN